MTWIIREGTKRGDGRYLGADQWSNLRVEAFRFRSLEDARYEAQIQVERAGDERGEPQWQCRVVRLVRLDWKARAEKAEADRVTLRHRLLAADAKIELLEADAAAMREHVAGCEEDASVLLESLRWTRSKSSDPYGCEWRDPVLNAHGGRESRTTAGALVVACGRLRDDLRAADAKLAELRTEREDVSVAVLREREACARECDAWARSNHEMFMEPALAAESCAARIRARKDGAK